MNGTVFGAVAKSDMHDFKIIHPPQELIKKFNSFTEGMYKAIWHNTKQYQKTSKICDALLPKLMSGEIRS